MKCQLVEPRIAKRWDLLCEHCGVNRSSEGQFEFVKCGGRDAILVCSPCAEAIRFAEVFLLFPEWKQIAVMKAILLRAGRK